MLCIQPNYQNEEPIKTLQNFKNQNKKRSN